MNFKHNYLDEPEMGSTGTGKGIVAGCCGHGNEPCCSIKYREILN